MQGQSNLFFFFQVTPRFYIVAVENFGKIWEWPKMRLGSKVKMQFTNCRSNRSNNDHKLKWEILSTFCVVFNLAQWFELQCRGEL